MSEPAGAPPRVASLRLPLRRPIATWLLLGAILAVFGVETLQGGSTQTEVLVRMGAKVGPLIAAGEYWRLFTCIFLHVGLAHVALNGYALAVIGRELETILGWQRFSLVFLLSGLFGSLASYALSPNLAAGASGAVFGLIGALASFFLLYRERLGAWGRSRLANIGFLVLVNLAFGFTRSGIDNWAHLGGLLSGLALGAVVAPRYQLDPVAFRLTERSRARQMAWAVLAAVLLLAALAGAVTVGRKGSFETRLWQAGQTVERKEWAQARTELEQLQQAYPDAQNSTLYFYLGLTYNHVGRDDLAAPAYERALALAPDESSARWNLALTYAGLGRTREALAEFQAYLERNPDRQDEVQPYLDELGGRSP